MGKPHPIELRARVVAFVEEGNSNREAARHFRVSPRFVNNMMILHRSSGSLAPARQGHPPGSKLSAHGQWISERCRALARSRWTSSASNWLSGASRSIGPRSAGFCTGLG